MMGDGHTKANSVTVFRKHPTTGLPFSVEHVDKKVKWFTVAFYSDEPPNPIRFGVATSTNRISFFKNFVNECKEEEEEWEEMKPFLRRLKVLSGLDQNRFEFINSVVLGECYRAGGRIGRNGDQFSLLEQ